MMYFVLGLCSFVHAFITWKAARNIPEQTETWIAARNVQKIKTVLLSRDVHLGICGQIEEMCKGFQSLETICSHLSGPGLVPPQGIARLRSVQSSLKLVKVHHITIQGVNLIVNRMQNKQAREKSALFREYLVWYMICFGRAGPIV